LRPLPTVRTLFEQDRFEIDEIIEMLTGNLDKILEHGTRADTSSRGRWNTHVAYPETPRGRPQRAGR
jgi:hypothetical protein